MATVYAPAFARAAGSEAGRAEDLHPHLVREAGFLREVPRRSENRVATEPSERVQRLRLGEIDGSYYSRWSTLHGATLAEVIREAGVGPRPAEPDAMARIVADAASRAPRAHELRDSTGRSLDLIHRDVSAAETFFVLADGIAKVLGLRHRTIERPPEPADRGRGR